MKPKPTEKISSLDVKTGDIIFNCGHRCRVSNVMHHNWNGKTVARFNLNSAPNEFFPDELPNGYEGMESGGNVHKIETREIRATYSVGQRVVFDCENSHVENRPGRVEETFDAGGWLGLVIVDEFGTSWRLSESNVRPGNGP